MKHIVLLDTSFFIRLLNDVDPLHNNAKEYFRCFLENSIQTKISTISIAEYCVKGNIEELPLRNLQIVPFNLDHAKRAGVFAEVMFTQKNITAIQLTPRAIIPNDAKLFAQADCDSSTSHFITSDRRSQDTFSLLLRSVKPRFDIIDINRPANEVFGYLDLIS